MTRGGKRPFLDEPTVSYGRTEGRLHALNHVLGCSHGCTYPCYAFSSALRHGKVESWNEWLNARPVEGALRMLEKSLDSWRPKPIERVIASVSTDPFMHGREDVAELTLSCITAINSRDVPVTVLTKGVLPEPGALSRHDGNEFGVSLPSIDEAYRELTEPGAAPYEARIASLKALHDAGLRIWVMVEPFPTPFQMGTLSSKWHAVDVLERVPFVDRVVFGPFRNAHAGGSWDQWHLDECLAARAFCDARGIAFAETEPMARLVAGLKPAGCADGRSAR